MATLQESRRLVSMFLPRGIKITIPRTSAQAWFVEIKVRYGQKHLEYSELFSGDIPGIDHPQENEVEEISGVFVRAFFLGQVSSRRRLLEGMLRGGSASSSPRAFKKAIVFAGTAAFYGDSDFEEKRLVGMSLMNQVDVSCDPRSSWSTHWASRFPGSRTALRVELKRYPARGVNFFVGDTPLSELIEKCIQVRRGELGYVLARAILELLESDLVPRVA